MFADLMRLYEYEIKKVKKETEKITMTMMLLVKEETEEAGKLLESKQAREILWEILNIKREVMRNITTVDRVYGKQER